MVLQIIKRLYIWITFYFIIGEAALEIGLNMHNYKISDAAVTIIEKCFSKVSGTVVLAGNWSNTTHDVHRRFSKSRALGVLGRSKSLLRIRPYNKKVYDFRIEEENRFAQPAPVVLIQEVGIGHALPLTLKFLKNSTWWNHEAFYLVLCDNCENATDVLRTIWNFDLLYAACLCERSDGVINVYGFNPYTNEAPSSWEKIDMMYGRYEHAISLFRQRYDPDNESFCEELHFDKTLSLGSYPIRLCASELNFVLTIDRSKRGLDRYAGASSEFSRVLWNKLNASPVITEYRSLGYVNDRGLPTGMLADIVFGKQDMGMTGRWQRFFWKQQTVPYDVETVCIITRDQGKIAMFEKMKIIIQPILFLSIACLFVLSMVVWKYALHTDLSQAALEELRILLVTATLYEPPVAFKKFIFTLMIFIHAVINSYFQSRLSALSSVSPSRLNIDSEEDLLSSNLTIYGRQEYKEYLTPDIPFERFRICEITNCIRLIRNDTPVACIEGCNMLKSTVVDEDVHHVAKHSMRNFYVVFVTREDWPLYQRVNTVILKMLEAGLYTFFKHRELSNVTKYPNQLLQEKTLKYSPITLQQMNFGFGLFAIGLGLSVAAFLIEMMLEKCSYYIFSFKLKGTSNNGGQELAYSN